MRKATGLVDRRLGQVSGRRVPIDRAEEVEALYRERYPGFTVKHFHEHLVKHHGFGWGYTWLKLQPGHDPPGFLRISITTYLGAGTSQWIETAKASIGDLLPEIVGGIMAAGPILEQRKRERQEEEKRRREAEARVRKPVGSKQSMTSGGRSFASARRIGKSATSCVHSWSRSKSAPLRSPT